MSLSKSKFWYSIIGLHFSKHAAPLVEGWNWAFNAKAESLGQIWPHFGPWPDELKSMFVEI